MIKILAVDPSTNSIGVALFFLDEKLKIVDIKTHLIDAAKISSPLFAIPDMSFKLKHIYVEFKKLIKDHNPDYVTMESPFISRFQPTSVIPLSKAIGVMELVLMQQSPQIRFSTIAPKRVKSMIGANANLKGKDTKDAVEQAVKKKKEITNLLKPTGISEHEFDALAINWIFLDTLRKAPDLLMKR